MTTNPDGKGQGMENNKWSPYTLEQIDKVSAEVHKCYCLYHMARYGKSYWTEGDYEKLDEATKNADREMAYWHLEKIDELKAVPVPDVVWPIEEDFTGNEIGEATPEIWKAEGRNQGIRECIAAHAKAQKEQGEKVDLDGIKRVLYASCIGRCLAPNANGYEYVDDPDGLLRKISDKFLTKGPEIK